MLVYPHNLLVKVNKKIDSSFKEGQKFLEKIKLKAI